MAYGSTWDVRAPETASAPVPITQPSVTSPFTDPDATAQFNRLVAAGTPPDQAATIVRTAMYGVQHDWQYAGGDTGKPWASTELLGEHPTYDPVVDQYKQWQQFYDPNAPDPNRPYHPDPEHNRSAYGVDVGTGKDYWVEKPIDSPFAPGVLNAQGARAPGAGGAGGGGGGGVGGAGGVPAFSYTPFVAPTYEEALASPGYQFRLGEGTKALERSAAAKGTLRTGGTLKDIMDYGQKTAADEYANVFGRALQGWGVNYQGQQDVFAPQYGAWQTQYTTEQDAALRRYLQREQNIYGLIAQPAPAYPTWS